MSFPLQVAGEDKGTARRGSRCRRLEARVVVKGRHRPRSKQAAALEEVFDAHYREFKILLKPEAFTTSRRTWVTTGS